MEPINPILNHHEEIDPHDIFPQVEDKLRAPIAGLPPCFVFRCHACRKARRDPSILDPADLFLPRTCADAGATCDDPDCGEEPFTIQYLPGSFVLAEYGGPLWPAMVEYCPDESAAYCLRHPQPGVNLNDIAPYAYYIVFIGCDEHRLFGGWYSRQRLRPIPNGAAEAEINDPARRAALQQCNNYRHHSLRQRLLALSHSAANLRRQGLGMNGNRHTYN